ncbi:urease accessory protein UreH domain-containing protein [Demequina salsinemoris]|uniref:urease accessory protein UreH domain-containing protein n=1 Tax=Demequina salsinemoris TaxID=577470 RepID=UPI000785AC6D|nr:sulfite exporter TauE/SafE family protein [Demequina salsinemoris]
MTTRAVPITGMTCSSCEETVAESLLALPGVDFAVANRRAGRVELEGTSLPADAEVARALESTPYGVGTRPWLSRDHLVWRDLAISVGIVGALAILAWAVGLGERFQALTQATSAGSTLVVLGLGVAASVSTCMALVGGLVISLAATTRSSASGMARMAPHLAFNAGRIVGFGALGALVGLVGRALAPSGLLLTTLVLAAAAVMAIVGIRLTETSPRVAAWQLTLPGRWGGWARAGADGSGGTMRAGILGAATFFLPCGFTQAVQLYALSTGSPTQGAFVMAVFAVGTTPGLLAAGFAASTARRGSGRALRGVGVAVIAFALLTGAGAITQLAPGLATGTIVATERTSNVADVGGVQVVGTDVVTEGYSPEVTVVYAGEPVEWTVTPLTLGCQTMVRADSLGVGHIDALNVPVTVEFTIDEPGTYPYACVMGMYTGAFVAIERPSA